MAYRVDLQLFGEGHIYLLRLKNIKKYKKFTILFKMGQYWTISFALHNFNKNPLVRRALETQINAKITKLYFISSQFYTHVSN